MISELAKQVTLKDGGVLSKAHGILISEEFDTMFVKDPDALTILTTLYNTHELDEWKNTLKGSGTEVLKEPCISLLLASNEKLWTSSVKAKDTEGGFLARTIIAYEAETTVINDLIDPDPDMISEEKLPFFVDELREISKITGEFEWTKEGKEIYRPWYYDIRTTKFDDKTGSINRLGDQVLKVAMLLNLVNERDLKLHGGNIELAIAKCEECLKGVRILSHSTGREISSGDLSATHLEVLKILFGSKDGAEMSRKKLLDRLWPNVDANTLDRAMDTLKEQEAVEIIGPPRKPIYRITSEGVKLFSRFVREIKEGS